MEKDYILTNRIKLKLLEPPSSFLNLKAKLNEDIEKNWLLEQKKNPNVFNGRLFSVINFDIDEFEKNNTLEIFATDYKSFLAQKSGIELGIESIGVTGVISKEVEGVEKLLFAQRAGNNSIYGEFWELVPSGGLDTFDLNSAEDAVIRQLLVEFEEELGGREELVEVNELFAMSFDSKLKVFDLIYLLQISQDFSLQLSSEHKKHLFLSEEEFNADYFEKSLPNCKIIFKALRESKSIRQ